MSALDAAVALYRSADPAVRWHVRLRRALSCLEAVEAALPRAGAVLEVGCGHGLFTNYAALASPERRVLGIDIDPRKLAAARRTARAGVRFEEGDARTPPPGPFDAIVIVDVLYLLDEAGQAGALDALARTLRPGGVLVWKTQVDRPRWKFWITRGQEWLVTRAGLTAGASLTFLSRERALALLDAAGFRDVEARGFPGRIYTDVLYVARAS